MQRLEWGVRALFQDGTLTWMEVGSLSSSAHGPSHTLTALTTWQLTYPSKSDWRANKSKRKGEKADRCVSFNLVFKVAGVSLLLFYSRKPLNPALTQGEEN